MNPHRRIRPSAALNHGQRSSRPARGGLIVAALILLPLLAVAGSDGLRDALDFTTGVLTLVSLTASVAWGLLATDRMFLSTRQRLVCQGVHRAAAVTSLGFLVLHGTVKVALGHIGVLGALVPFGTGVSGAAGLIGFGSLAGLLMIVTAATGALRSAFAAPGGTAGRWRALHALAYPAWCAALVHGLYAGRQPATWVVVMYMLCLAAVVAVLGLRLLPGPAKRLVTDLAVGRAGPDTTDPVIRPSVPPEPSYAPRPRHGLPPEAPGWGDDRGLGVGTPVRPRTLTAPGQPAAAAYGPPGHNSPPYGSPPQGFDLSSRAPGRPARPAGPPRSTDLRTGFSAAYRAVTHAGPPVRPPDAEEHRPSPAPVPPSPVLDPARAPHTQPSQDPDRQGARPPGPLYPPLAGEPWSTPAGERP
ncbi:hypothetical protein AB0M42_15815 [Streptomyces sp. NPDC051784]|uniref:hypothetical protein n=1 Tax=Streptomyces sp. NPDC051784 TaxID=3155805 RepID=UPI00342121E0